MNIFRLLTIMLIAAPLMACSQEQAADPSAQTARPVLTVVAKSDMRGRTTTYVGEIVPRLETPIAFKSNGRIAERLVNVGDVVQQGQVLIRLERSDFENQLLVAQAEVATAKAALSTAQATLERQSTLVKSGAVSRATFDAAAQEAESARARLESAEANANVARQALDHTEIVAPMAGVVTAASGNPSQVVTAGQEVVRVATLDRPEAVFDVPEQLIKDGNQDIAVSLALLSDPSVVATGRVNEVSPIADSSTRTYRVRVAIDNAPERMLLGAPLSGSLVLDDQIVFELPATSLTSQDGGPAVYVVDEATKTVARKPITISHQNAASLFVSHGLEDGDRVVTAGVSTLRPGQTVALSEAAR